MGRIRWLQLVAFALIFGAIARADSELLSAVLKPTRDYVATVETEIPQWQSAATWYRVLSFCVALLGLAPAFLRAFSPKPKQGDEGDVKLFGTFNVLAAAGALATLLTLVTTWGFEADHRAYKRAVQEAERLSANFHTQEALLTASPDANDPVRLTELYQKQIEPLFNNLVAVKTSLTSSVAPWRRDIVYAAASNSTRAVGEANFDWQAQQNSQVSATEQMLNRVMMNLQLTLGPSETDALRGYINLYGKRTQTRLDPGPKGLRIQTELTLNETFLNPTLVRAYIKKAAGENVSREQQIDSLRAISSRNPPTTDDGFIEGSATLRAPAGEVTVKNADPKNGSFAFRFTIKSDARQGSILRLTAMDIQQDASAGSAEWSFYVLIDGKVILMMPSQRWDDSKHPTKCWWEEEAWLAKQVQLKNGTLPLSVVGIKSKLRDAL